MDQVLTYINKYITVNEDERQDANPILHNNLTQVTNRMKEISPLFKALFEGYIYAGSSFDGLKIGKPDEFDIDLKLNLPDILNVEVLNSDRPGFVRLQLRNWGMFKMNQYSYPYYSELEQLKDSENYLSHEKLIQWMQSVVERTIRSFSNINYKVSGPAMTLIIGNKMTIDLVAVFSLPKSKWPSSARSYNKQLGYVVVPKGPKISSNNRIEQYWRISFPEQEKDYMNSLQNCKPVIRYLKKLRDTRSHNIPSYFIKTVFLNEIEKRDKSFWSKDLSVVFLEMLKTYKTYLENGRIPYFWAPSHNLIQPYLQINISNIVRYLAGAIEEIERYKNSDPVIVAKHILPDKEYTEVCKHFGVRKV